MKIKYVGLKDFEDAFSSETGKTWGPGIEHDIDPAIAARMLRHPDVFALADGAPVKEPATLSLSDAVVVTPVADEQDDDDQDDASDTGNVPNAEEQPKAKHIMQTKSGPLTLDALDKDTLKALAKELGVAVGNSGAEKIREKLVEAFPVKD